MDGETFKDKECSGIEVVIRNDRGLLMGAMSKNLAFPMGAIETKAKAIEEGIGLAWDLRLKTVVI